METPTYGENHQIQKKGSACADIELRFTATWGYINTPSTAAENHFPVVLLRYQSGGQVSLCVSVCVSLSASRRFNIATTVPISAAAGQIPISARCQ